MGHSGSRSPRRPRVRWRAALHPDYRQPAAPVQGRFAQRPSVCQIDQQVRRLGVGLRQCVGQDQGALPHPYCRFQSTAPCASAAHHRGGTRAHPRCFPRRAAGRAAGWVRSGSSTAGQPQHAGCAPHVFLHQQHGSARLQVQAPAVETHAFADQRDPGGIGRSPSQVQQAGFTGAAGAHSTNQRKPCASSSAPTRTRQRAPKRAARSKPACASSAGPRSLAGALIRSRASVVASAAARI